MGDLQLWHAGKLILSLSLTLLSLLCCIAAILWTHESRGHQFGAFEAVAQLPGNVSDCRLLPDD